MNQHKKLSAALALTDLLLVIHILRSLHLPIIVPIWPFTQVGIINKTGVSSYDQNLDKTTCILHADTQFRNEGCPLV